MFHQPRRQGRSGDDQHPLARHQSLQTIHRFLRRRAGARERKQLLGAIGCAEGPEAGPGPAGQNHRPPHEAEQAEAARRKRELITLEKGGQRGAVAPEIVQ